MQVGSTFCLGKRLCCQSGTGLTDDVDATRTELLSCLSIGF